MASAFRIYMFTTSLPVADTEVMMYIVSATLLSIYRPVHLVAILSFGLFSYAVLKLVEAIFRMVGL